MRGQRCSRSSRHTLSGLLDRLVTVVGVHEVQLTRRESLARLAGFALVGLGAAGLDTRETDAASVSCILTPEQSEGPYYIAGEKLRRNITDGHPGAPMQLRTFVVDAATCRPIRNAAVDVWHADAAGVYSGFDSGASSRTFMRGIQRTNAKGLAQFRTVYPGWYQGRTVHVHVKVHVGRNVVHTGQLYFPDSLTDAVYRQAPYSSRPNRTTRNADDMIFRSGGSRSTLKVKRSGAGIYVATITMGVHR
jgi:protocatechuate 3,4-dioxygenase beta subunit